MQTCQLNDFLKVLDPWLDRDYIRKVHLTDQDHLVFFFTDGGQKACLLYTSDAADECPAV